MQITVMQIGWGEKVVDDTIKDLHRLFDHLAIDGLIEKSVFEPKPFADPSSGRLGELIRELALIAFDLAPNISLRSYLLQKLAAKKLEPMEQVIKRVDGFCVGNRLGFMEASVIAEACQRALVARKSANLEEMPNLPDIIWLPPSFRGQFDTLYGISTVRGHGLGLGTMLCPPRYYSQLIWHETLHLCLGCDDCYADGGVRTCELGTCIMQWDPELAAPDFKSWLCARQTQWLRAECQGVMECVETLRSRGDSGLERG